MSQFNPNDLPPAAKAILAEAEKKADQIAHNQKERMKELLETIEARCGKIMASAALHSTSTLTVMLNMLRVMAKMGAPYRVTKPLMDNCKEIHMALLTHLVSTAAMLYAEGDEAKASTIAHQELSIIQKMLEDQFKLVEDLETLAEDTSKRVQQIMDSEG